MSENEMNYTPDLYTLVDDEGNEQTFEMLDAMEYNGETYYALTPYPEDLDNDGEVVILKKVIENDEEIMVSIEDDDEYEEVGNKFMERIEDMFEFDDEESQD
ncbi:MAG: DUF1292 domain-containing protein [Oscillospiraceae bacterium]|nr:DUF1292 domain-containing protein [Oscillospiraceae bacterium]